MPVQKKIHLKDFLAISKNFENVHVESARQPMLSYQRGRGGNSTEPKNEKCSKWPENDKMILVKFYHIELTPPPCYSTWGGQLNMGTKIKNA